MEFDGLTVDFAKEIGADAMLRGLRAVSDFEYELQLALMNKYLDKKIDTVFLVPDYRYLYLSSSIIRQVIGLGGRPHDQIPAVVEEAIIKKFEERELKDLKD